MKKRTMIILLLLIVLVVCVTIFAGSYIKEHSYNQAEMLLNEKLYDDAISQFEKIKTYKDSSEKVIECTYLKAEYMYENGNYEDSYKIWNSILNYKDSKDKSIKAKYELSKQYAENENYKDAYLNIIELNDYENSNELSKDYFKLMIEHTKVGDTIFYGKYEQDGNENNGDEPIEWLILGKENNNTLLISKYILEKMRFGTGYYWKSSEIRSWMNNEFYNNSFSNYEKEHIQKMITSNETEDNIFCLSAEEARILFELDWDRVAYPTQKLKNANFKVWSDMLDSGEWWTRSISTATNGKGVVPVEGDGNVRSAGTNPLAPEKYTYTDIGARPSICINIDTIQEQAINMNIFGHDSNSGLDNEPNIQKKSSSTNTSSSSAKCPKSGQYAGLWGDANIGKCPLCGKQCGVTRTNEKKQVETWNHTKVYKEVCVYNAH